jgi:hypothetical protein
VSTVDGTYTVNDVVTAALRKSGIIGLGQVPNGADVLDAQNDLADMLAQWNVKTWLTWGKLDLAFVADGRAGPGQGGAYTIGPGGNYNVTPRPDRIEEAYCRILASVGANSNLPVDQPLREIPSHEGYAKIALKQLVAFPKSYFYDSQSPLGNVIFYPWPQAAIYEMHVIIKNAFPLTLPLNASLVNLPPECFPAMKFGLARRLRQGYGKGLKPDPELNDLAKDALATMRNSHIQVPELQMPSMLRASSHYNIYGDITYALFSSVALGAVMWNILHLGGLFT